MINLYCVSKYCSEDPSLIENYEQAVNDQTQMWDCHHRKQTDEGLTRQELIDKGLYFNRPAAELIFLSPAEHKRLHANGENNNFYGKHHSNETKINLSTANNCKPIYQIDKNSGKIIKKWQYLFEIKNALGISTSNIVNCCKGLRKSAGGFKWKYAE